ncbi:MAG: GntR family transcriptional regulator [Rhodobacteraceae bacterium]|nr:GntR family transcriptional regulator [Paracoccaceae bacterium]
MTLLEQTVQMLRERILAGHYAPDDRLPETTLADDLNVSRTVVRLALGAMAREGLVENRPNRGFRLRSFSLDEVTDAIALRGTVEGMAARLAAERGASAAALAEMRQILARMDAAVSRGFATLPARSAWIEMNAALHDAIIAASGHATIPDVVAQLSRMPLVSARAIVFDAGDGGWGLSRVVRAHDDHHAVVDAISARQGARAEALMREHALRSGQNKRQSFAAMKSGDTPLPGLSLVRG